MSRFKSSFEKTSWGQRNFDSEILTGLANLFLAKSYFSGYNIHNRIEIKAKKGRTSVELTRNNDDNVILEEYEK